MALHVEVKSVDLESVTFEGDAQRITRITGIVIAGQARLSSGATIDFEGRLPNEDVQTLNGMIEAGADRLWLAMLGEIEQHTRQTYGDPND